MRRSSLVLVVLALIGSVLPARALPPAAAGAIASANVEWVGNIPDVAAIGGRIVGDILYVTTATGVRLFDVSLGGIPVPMGALPLPHFENEDVDTNGEILLIAADYFLSRPDTHLWVIDVSNPNVPSVMAGPVSVPEGHTVSCINDCTYAWLAGGSTVHVMDLRDPANPVRAGAFGQPCGGTHDVQVDASGVAWVVGGNGICGFTTTDPVKPTLIASKTNDTPGSFDNDFILHNSLRPNATTVRPDADHEIDPGELLLVTEEDWLAASNGNCVNDGKFQTGWYRTTSTGATVIEKLAEFSVGRSLAVDQEKPWGIVACSSHYFDYRPDGIVSVAWYEQGVRFLDVSNPREIRQIGYFMPAATEVWNVQHHNGTFYTFDVARGIDVLTFTGNPGDPPVTSPALNPLTVESSMPTERWGYACRIPRAV